MLRHFTRLRRLLSPRSYRGRYLLLVATFSLVLLGAAHVGQTLVRDTAEQNAERSSRTAQLLGALSDTARQLDRLRGDLLNFSIDPEHTGSDAVFASDRALQAATHRLTMLVGESGSQSLAELDRVLQHDSEQLSVLISELVTIRLSSEAWMPASRTLTEELLPWAMRIRTQLQNIEAMIAPLPDSARTHLALKELQSYWLSQVGEVRLMVANRFSGFETDHQAAMQAREYNLDAFGSAARQALQRLPQYLRLADDEPLLSEYRTLIHAYEQWAMAADRLTELLRSDAWRQDTYYMRTTIEPVIARMQQRIGAVRLQIQTEAQQLLNEAMENSALLARVISWGAVGVILLFLLGYVAFEHWLLLPIEHIAQQLKHEAEGHLDEPAHRPAPVAETRALVEAFAEMHRQVTARQQRLDHMAHHDALTGLPNRVLFRRRLERALSQPLEEDRSIAVLFLDLDRFKQINDSHGHLVGDKLLVQVARRLRSVFRSEDTVARISGDEFAVLLHASCDRGELTGLAQKVVAALRPPIGIDGHTYHCSASIGITMAPQDGGDADQLIQHADAAMYHAKAAGRSGYCLFTQDMIEQSTALLNLETELYAAVEQQQLMLYLQPVVELDSGRLHAYECLLRWQHPQRGVLTPDDFLATLEDIGLLQRIADWTLDQVAGDGITQDHVISINLPAKLLLNPSFADSLLRRLTDRGLDPTHLIVEITEDSFSGDLAEAHALLRELSGLGVRIALDDFGTGQSSLSHLRDFPFDLVKIDRSFIHDIEQNPQNATLVHAVIVLATTLGIEVVGEGIETAAQRQLLKEHGCRYGQGYLFGVPTPLGSHDCGDRWG